MVKTSIHAELVLITPEKAKALLKLNTHNRPLSRNYVTILANVIRRGEWKDNGETIKVAKTGALLDGQHRLAAVVECSQSVKMLVAEGLEDDVFATIDTGKRRTASDALAVMGTKNYATVAAAVRLILTLANKEPTFREPFTNEQIKEWAEVYADELQQFMSIASKVYATKLMMKGTIVGLCYLMQQKDDKLIEAFWSRVATGENMTRGDPILALRNRLIDNRLAAAKLEQRDIVALTIKAWNKTRKNEMLHPRAGLAWRADEGFPKVR